MTADTEIMLLRASTKQYLLSIDKLYNKKGNINANIHKMLRNDALNNIRKMYPGIKTGIAVHCIVNDIIQPSCEICNKLVTYYNKEKNQYAECCSIQCSRKTSSSISKRAQTKSKKYGHHAYNNRKKSKETCNKKYGVDNPSQHPTIKSSIKNTVDLLYKKGIPQKKREKTFMERYNGHPQKTREIKEKKLKNTLNKYGVEHTTQLSDVIKKIKNTKEKYYKEQYQWAIDYIIQQPIPKLRTTLAEETGLSLVVISNLIDQYNLPYHEVTKGTSEGQKEIENFLEENSIDFEIKNRTMLNGKEIDIYIPSKNIAIEFNGIFWHSEKYGKDENYHLEKTIKCEEKGIQLLQIWDIEWNDPIKKEIWKSMILSRLGKNNKIYAKKCIVKSVNTKDARKFLEQNHLQGFAGGETKLGLYYNNELVQLIVVGKSRYNKNVTHELIRSASKNYKNIVGGMSKLLKKINTSLISYADRRYSQGHSYEKLGFVKQKSVKPNYFYVIKNSLESRISYQKHKLHGKLKKFDASLTEVENMHLNNFYRIWDCGNLSYIKMESQQQ
jgi:G:T-mismatch repair DNA endonuclease (very short patch repair protein)